MRVAVKIATGSGLMLGLLLAVVAYDLVQLERLSEANRELSEVSFQATLLALEEERLLLQIDEFTRKLFVTRDAAYAARLESLAAEFAERLAELRALPLSPAEQAAVLRLAERWAELPLASVAQAAAESVAPGALPAEPVLENPTEPALGSAAERDELLAAAVGQLGRVREAADQVAAATRGAVAARVERSARRSREAGTLSRVVTLVAVGLSLPILWLTIRSIHEPLKRLTEGTREVAEGRFTYRLEVGTNDELARVAEGFNEMVERLAEVDLMKKEFVSHVSHELKTPLVAMQETNELLLEEIPGPLNPKQRRLLELHLDSNRRLAAMIARLLDLSRMEAGAMEFDLAVHDLRYPVQTVVERFAARAAEQGVELVTECPPRWLPARCDADRIVEVLENLVDNALKFSPAGGRVVVRAMAEEAVTGRPGGPGAESGGPGRVLLEVADTGPGVADADKARIFTRFWRAAGRGSAGVGLGLAICREIVAAHGGAIWVTDDPGGGSVFHVALPRTEAGKLSESAA